MTAPGTFMDAELTEQPERWMDLLAGSGDSLADAADLLRGQPDAPVIFVARGSSDHAATYGQYLLQLRLRRAAFLSTPSVASLGEVNVIPSNAIVVAISQSGESPDLVTSIDRARSAGSRVISLTNNPSSAMAQLAHVSVDLRAGPELSVAATKTYTAELLALAAIVGMTDNRHADLTANVLALAEVVGDGIASFKSESARIARVIAGADRLMVVGRTLSMATAKEAALKFMETGRFAASGWSAADAKHGPIGQISSETAMFLAGTSGLGSDSVLSLGDDARALGATVITPRFDGSADLGDLEPIAGIVPFQMIAREAALIRGIDPDRPKGLQKVTLTR